MVDGFEFHPSEKSEWIMMRLGKDEIWRLMTYVDVFLADAKL